MNDYPIMVGSNLLTIQPVNNGFIVTLPFEQPTQNPYEPYVEALKSVMGDPLLKEDKQQHEKKKPDFRTQNVHVFDTWEKVLAFLSKLG